MAMHPEIPLEQKYFDEALHWRELRRQELDRLAEAGIHRGAASGLAAFGRSEQQKLGPPDSAVAFARMDKINETVYIGLHLITDDQKNPLVINWQTDQASSYYRATRENPLGVRRKRSFTTEGNTIVNLSDDILDEDAEDFALVYPGMEDPLLADLERHRLGEMRDIVKTIQAAQDFLIRHPLERTLVVQGGPGTGKTAVGLHRASYLFYTYPHLIRDGVLIVGPNRAFMRYIANVLPSLGDTSATQLPVTGLGPQIGIRKSEPAAARRLKGDARMAELLRRAIVAQRSVPTEPEAVRIGGRTVTLQPQIFESLTRTSRDLPHNQLRDQLRERLASHIGRELGISEGQVFAAADFDNLMERVCPRLTPQAFLRDTFTVARRLRDAAEGLLSDEERDVLVRPAGGRLSEEPWTEADYPLLDEASWLLDGEPERFGHVIVDEAQDLTPMQLRSIARRCGGTISVFGDLAQATGDWIHESWYDVLAHLPSGEDADIEELGIGYRVPAQVYRLAARLLPDIAPELTPPEAIREGPSDPDLVSVAADQLLTRTIEAARRYAADGNSVGIITSEDMAPAVGQALTGVGVNWSDEPSGGITVLPASAAKGLEFDCTVVVEPAAIAREGVRGLRLLYVALTRCTRQLSVVHNEALPSQLLDDAQQPRAAAEPVPAYSTTSASFAERERRPAADAEIASTLEIALVRSFADTVASEIERLVPAHLWPALIEEVRERLALVDAADADRQVGAGEDEEESVELPFAPGSVVDVLQFRSVHPDYYKGIYVPAGQPTAVSIRFKPVPHDEYGYADRWIEEGRVLEYTGQGAAPKDQEWNRWNLGLRNACDMRQRVHVFEQLQDGSRKYRYWGAWRVRTWYEQRVDSQNRTVFRFVLEA